MNRDETVAVLAVLRGAYPNFYKGMTTADQNGIIGLWQEMFAEDEAALVMAAVKAHIACDAQGYPPVIGKIKERLRQLTNPPKMTELEAWGFVKKALRNSAYNSGAEFEKLPPVIQRLVGSPAQLRSWAMLEDGTDDYIAGQFQRSYKSRAEIERENMSLPPSVKAFTDKLGAWGGDRKELGDGGDR